jgi:hypothetical protein
MVMSLRVMRKCEEPPLIFWNTRCRVRDFPDDDAVNYLGCLAMFVVK